VGGVLFFEGEDFEDVGVVEHVGTQIGVEYDKIT
jgi:hypothetical protein